MIIASRDAFKLTVVLCLASGVLGQMPASAADVLAQTTNTPKLVLDQIAGSGFSPYKWDVAGNEVNFFVRDVSGGSRRPFRIRPGAPTSSIDIAATGNVGFGTFSPARDVHIMGGDTPTVRLHQDTTAGKTEQIWDIAVNGTGFTLSHADADPTRPFLVRKRAPTNALTVASNGNVGIGVGKAKRAVHVNGRARVTGIKGCAAGIRTNGKGDLTCIISSARFKTISGALPADVAAANIMALKPAVGSYIETPEEPEHWLIAEETATIDPALVGLKNGEPYTVKTQNVVADLVAVVQLQQRTIEEQSRRIEALETRLAE